jgi:hypothetical protein
VVLNQQNYITILNNSSFHELKGFEILNLIIIFGIKSFSVFQSAFEIVMFVREDKIGISNLRKV